MRKFIGRTNSNPGQKSDRGKLFENPFFIKNFQHSQHLRRRLKAKNRPEKPVQSESTDGFYDNQDQRQQNSATITNNEPEIPQISNNVILIQQERRNIPQEEEKQPEIYDRQHSLLEFDIDTDPQHRSFLSSIPHRGSVAKDKNDQSGN